jgi:hypothetical protein
MLFLDFYEMYKLEGDLRQKKKSTMGLKKYKTSSRLKKNYIMRAQTGVVDKTNKRIELRINYKNRKRVKI